MGMGLGGLRRAASSAHPGPDVPIPGDNLGSPETPHGPAPRQLQTLIVGPWQTRSRRTSRAVGRTAHTRPVPGHRIPHRQTTCLPHDRPRARRILISVIWLSRRGRRDGKGLLPEAQQPCLTMRTICVAHTATRTAIHSSSEAERAEGVAPCVEYVDRARQREQRVNAGVVDLTSSICERERARERERKRWHDGTGKRHAAR